MAESLEELIEKFRRAGCKEPESWARSEADDNAQFARFIFLRELWKCVSAPGSKAWLRTLPLENDDGQGGAKRRLKDSTAAIDDLSALVRAAQIDVVRNVAALLDGYAPEGGMVEEVTWGLFELDENHQPQRDMDSLHESVDDEEFTKR